MGCVGWDRFFFLSQVFFFSVFSGVLVGFYGAFLRFNGFNGAFAGVKDLFF